MKKTGSKTRIYLQNEHGINLTINNDFANEIEFKVDIYNCINNTENTEEILQVINKHSKYGYKWSIYYIDELLLIFKKEDKLGNKHYLHIEF